MVIRMIPLRERVIALVLLYTDTFIGKSAILISVGPGNILNFGSVFKSYLLNSLIELWNP